jgi:hypothetical protein
VPAGNPFRHIEAKLELGFVPDLVRTTYLEDSGAKWSFALGSEEDHVTTRVRHAEDQHLALEAGDAARRKVHDRQNLASDELPRRIECGELGARPFDPERAEVNLELIGRFAGLRQRLGHENPPDPNVNFEERLDRSQPG